MHDHVGDLRALAPDSFLDLARTTVRVSERRPGIEAEGHKGDEAVVCLEEPQLTRRCTGCPAHDLLYEAGVALDRRAPGGLGERLEVSLDGDDLRERLRDRALDLACDGVRLLERHLSRQL